MADQQFAPIGTFVTVTSPSGAFVHATQNAGVAVVWDGTTPTEVVRSAPISTPSGESVVTLQATVAVQLGATNLSGVLQWYRNSIDPANLVSSVAAQWTGADDTEYITLSAFALDQPGNVGGLVYLLVANAPD